jgi:hypothetical protein
MIMLRSGLHVTFPWKYCTAIVTGFCQSHSIQWIRTSLSARLGQIWDLRRTCHVAIPDGGRKTRSLSMGRNCGARSASQSSIRQRNSSSRGAGQPGRSVVDHRVPAIPKSSRRFQRKHQGWPQVSRNFVQLNTPAKGESIRYGSPLNRQALEFLRQLQIEWALTKSD